MAFGNVRGMGIWGVALAASLALHVVVIGIMAIMGMGGGKNDVPPPQPIPQTDGRAQDLPTRTDAEQTVAPSVDDSVSSASSVKGDRLRQEKKGKQQDVSRSAKSERTKADSRKVSAAKEKDDRGIAAESGQDGWKSYKVKPGDSLTKIARACGCSVPELAKANGLSATASLMLGQTIKVKNMPSDAE